MTLLGMVAGDIVDNRMETKKAAEEQNEGQWLREGQRSSAQRDDGDSGSGHHCWK